MQGIEHLIRLATIAVCIYEGWNFNSGNYLFTTYTK